VNGLVREYHLVVPRAEQQSSPMALVFDLHGTGETPMQHAQLTQMGPIALREGFLLVWPVGQYRRSGSRRPSLNGKPSWNADMEPGPVDDVAFIRAIIAQLNQTLRVDPRRIFITGFSGGGRMTCRLACELSDQVAAIAPVSGLRFPKPCSISRPVPILSFHGEQDPLPNVDDADRDARAWANHYECANESVGTDESQSAKVIRYCGGASGAEVVFYRIPDAGHTWPGSPSAGYQEQLGFGKTNMQVPASELIWGFFDKHPMRQ
jgi:polyhydroxybutyrate depolymerase